MLTIKLSMAPSAGYFSSSLRLEVANGIDAGLSGVMSAAETRAREIAPYKTGTLRDSIRAYLKRKRQALLVSEAPYSSFLHEGTGIYGPHKRSFVIVPRDKEALWWPGAMHPVKIVLLRGISPRPFLKKALDETEMEAAFEKKFKREIGKD